MTVTHTKTQEKTSQHETGNAYTFNLILTFTAISMKIKTNKSKLCTQKMLINFDRIVQDNQFNKGSGSKGSLTSLPSGGRREDVSTGFRRRTLFRERNFYIGYKLYEENTLHDRGYRCKCHMLPHILYQIKETHKQVLK